MQKYSIDYIKSMLYEKYGYIYISGDYKGKHPLLTCKDDDGYMYLCNIKKMMYKGTKSKIVHTSNPYSIYNINRFLVLNGNEEFVCISNSYNNNKSDLEFKHLKCGRIIKNKWINICRGRYKDNQCKNKTGLVCDYCTLKQLESTHAIVLKQVWKHEHSDTVLEDNSCYNPNTNHVMPTDIVNHRLRIAIEVQSWFHDFEDQKIKDAIKKKFWIDSGYKFYAVDQRDYTILEMIQIFFPHLKEVPSYINFSYSNKFDDVTAQKLLNEYMSVNKVAEIMNCDAHLIYDAISNKRISYPTNYRHNRHSQVVQLDLNFNYIKCFDTIASAENETGVCGISHVLHMNRNYCGGYYWIRKKYYDCGDYTIKKTRLKNKTA